MMENGNIFRISNFFDRFIDFYYYLARFPHVCPDWAENFGTGVFEGAESIGAINFS